MIQGTRDGKATEATLRGSSMYRLFYLLLLLCSLRFFVHCINNPASIILEPGLVITHSGEIIDSQVHISIQDSNVAAITIQGSNLVIDFKECHLNGALNRTRPDLFSGIGIRIVGKNITLKNAKVSGYKIGLLAEGVDSLKIQNCDFSYSFRQRLGSTRKVEDQRDWLYYHHNDNDEWKRYGAAMYFKDCAGLLIRANTMTQGQNGIMLTNCQRSLIYNNDIRFNSGIGIGLYRSSNNQIFHNKLDFNVRGYSHGVYQRGQDSAGLLVYEQSSNNIFAYNSATHSGDGFFLWAGQHTMDSGEGGCNGNLIYANDFSFAPTNGIEVTFSSNKIISNRMEECRYGIWGGYSYETMMLDNQISNCDFGIAIEHGNNNSILDNRFISCNIGIKLWDRKQQPEDWGFATRRNVAGRNYDIKGNFFYQVNEPFKIKDQKDIALSENIINEIKDNLTRQISSGDKISSSAHDLPEQLSDGIDAFQDSSKYTGRKNIIVNEWGPYNFEYPMIWLRDVIDHKYIFAIFGPEGNWKIKSATGLERGSMKTGTFPTTLTAWRSDIHTENIKIELEYIGSEFVDQFGQVNERGTTFAFAYEESTQ